MALKVQVPGSSLFFELELEDVANETKIFTIRPKFFFKHLQTHLKRLLKYQVWSFILALS